MAHLLVCFIVCVASSHVCVPKVLGTSVDGDGDGSHRRHGLHQSFLVTVWNVDKSHVSGTDVLLTEVTHAIL